MSLEVIKFVSQSLAEGLAVALIVLSESGPGAPGMTGWIMAVREDGRQMGTIGGGPVEAKVVSEGRKILAEASSRVFPFDYSLREGGELGAICGGEARGLITVLRPPNRLIIFGGGHVGRKIYEAGLVAGFEVVMVEDRPEYTSQFPKAKVVMTENLGSTARQLDLNQDCYLVIVTRNHVEDYSVLSATIESQAAYIGLIGSRTKVSKLFGRLREQGVAEEQLRRIHSPIGLAIDDGTPGEIALAIMAEILCVKNKITALAHSRDQRPTP